MRRIKFKILVALFTFILGLAVWAFIQRPSAYQISNSLFRIPGQAEEVEEYLVYSALLQHSFMRNDVKLLAISEKPKPYLSPDSLKGTTAEGRVSWMRKAYPFAEEDTLRDFDAKSIQAPQLRPAFNLPVAYVLVDEADLIESSLDVESILDEASLKRAKEQGKYFLGERYPAARGLIRLSRVGFNKDRTEAFVSVEFVHCPLCGRGDRVLLEKRSGDWSVKVVFNGWISWRHCVPHNNSFNRSGISSLFIRQLEGLIQRFPPG